MRGKGDGILDELFTRRLELAACAAQVREARAEMATCFAAGGKLLVCGNGGSAADGEHVVGELMKGFRLKRPIGPAKVEALKRACPADWKTYAEALQEALPAISLAGHPALATAFANDASPRLVFAQQVLGFGRPGDILMAISTSGNSPNVLDAARVARAFGLAVVALTGSSGGALAGDSDVCVRVPADETWAVQELHESVYHAICAALEEDFFG